MPRVHTSERQEISTGSFSQPSISIVLPFDPKMSHKPSLVASLNGAKTEVNTLLRRDYHPDVADMMAAKLTRTIEKLNHATHTKSVAIYLSPVFEKTLYLNFEVNALVKVGDGFDLKQLLFQKKNSQRFFVLALGGTQSELFLGEDGKLKQTIASSFKPVFAHVRDEPERVANFTDPQSKREVVLDKMVQQLDADLGLILRSYRLPLFVIGLPRLAGHFKTHTRHNRDILQYIFKNGEARSKEEIMEMLKPYLDDWASLHQRRLLEKITDAYGAGKLITGAGHVYHAANSHRGQLLVIERGYLTGNLTAAEDVVFVPQRPYNPYFPVHDLVDQIVQTVIESGGDVEIVDDKLLEAYGGMVLLTYY